MMNLTITKKKNCGKIFHKKVGKKRRIIIKDVLKIKIEKKVKY